MSDVLSGLLEQLELEEIEVNLFRGITRREPRPRVFGGLVAAQALASACRTVDDGDPHSLHAYFLRPGKPGTPILYMVDRIRDGRSFTTRRVKAVQNGEAIFNMSVSFHKLEEGLEHQQPMPDVKSPDECISWQDWMRPLTEKMPDALAEYVLRDRPIDMRPIDPVDWNDPASASSQQRFWMRAVGELPDDNALHCSIAAYASDMALLGVTMRPHLKGFWSPDIMAASLDHAMWFHVGFRFDQWLLYDQFTPRAAGARGFARGSIYTSEGTLVASVAQEGLLRTVDRG